MWLVKFFKVIGVGRSATVEYSIGEEQEQSTSNKVIDTVSTFIPTNEHAHLLAELHHCDKFRFCFLIQRTVIIILRLVRLTVLQPNSDEAKNKLLQQPRAKDDDQEGTLSITWIASGSFQIVEELQDVKLGKTPSTAGVCKALQIRSQSGLLSYIRMSFQTAGDIPIKISSDNSGPNSERRITPSWTIGQLKAKLEPVTGIPPLSQKLTLRIGSNQAIPIEAADEENTQIGSFPLTSYAELHVSRRFSFIASRNML